MKTIVHPRYGHPDVLRVEECDVPACGPHDVLVRVRAASVNVGDWYFLTGRPWPIRFLSGLVRPKAQRLGMDVAGIVETVGSEVTRLRPGDEVFGQGFGTFAEYALVSEHRLAKKPSSLTFEQAATVPVAGATALQGLRDKAQVKAGQRVLVNGASGGVGSFAVQLAHALGAEVTAVCSPRNVERARGLGAAHVVDYTREDFTRTSQRYDAVFDLAGSAPLWRCRRLLRPKGVYVASVGRLDWSLKSWLAALVPGSCVSVLVARATSRDLEELGALFEAGQLRHVVERRYRLEEVPDALRYQGEGHAQGKSVIVMA